MAMRPLTGNSVTATSVGLSADGRATEPDAPTWRLMTVSVSSHARKNTSHAPECTDGNPSRSGVSGNDTARNPRAALARTSSAATDASASHGSWQGTTRSGCDPHHSSSIQSLYARKQASPSSGSRRVAKRRPAKPHTKEGKQTDAHTPLT